MKERNSFRIRSRVLFTVATLLALGSAGCELQEALVDGIYGGISDTVAGLLSMLVLGTN